MKDFLLVYFNLRKSCCVSDTTAVSKFYIEHQNKLQLQTNLTISIFWIKSVTGLN